MLTSKSWHQEIDINEEVSINEGTREIIAVNLDNVFLKKNATIFRRKNSLSNFVFRSI